MDSGETGGGVLNLQRNIFVLYLTFDGEIIQVLMLLANFFESISAILHCFGSIWSFTTGQTTLIIFAIVR